MSQLMGPVLGTFSTITKLGKPTLKRAIYTLSEEFASSFSSKFCAVWFGFSIELLGSHTGKASILPLSNIPALCRIWIENYIKTFMLGGCQGAESKSDREWLVNENQKASLCWQRKNKCAAGSRKTDKPRDEPTGVQLSLLLYLITGTPQLLEGMIEKIEP